MLGIDKPSGAPPFEFVEQFVERSVERDVLVAHVADVAAAACRRSAGERDDLVMRGIDAGIVFEARGQAE